MAASPLDLLILALPDFIRRAPGEVPYTYSEERYLPAGPLALASYLARRGRRAVVVPLRELYGPGGQYRYFDDGTEPALGAFTARTAAVLRDLLRRLSPRAVGLSISFAIHHRAAEVVLDLLRDLAPGLPLIAGGGHATFTADHWLVRPAPVRAVVLGEGEATTAELLDRGLDPAGVAGVAWRDAAGRAVRGPRRDPLPAAALDWPADLALAARPRGTPLNAYAHHVTLSRGCGHACAFCTSPALWGRRVRQRASAAVRAELTALGAAGVRTVFLADDLVPLGGPGFARVAELLRTAPGMRFAAMTRLDDLGCADPVALRGVGIERLWVGVESFSAPVLAAMGKRTRTRPGPALARVLSGMRDAGVEVAFLLLLGYPGSTATRDRATLRTCRSLSARGLLADVHPAFPAPFPGTRLASPELAATYRIVEPQWSAWTLAAPVLEPVDRRGRTTYPAAVQREVMAEAHALRAELGLGEAAGRRPGGAP